MDQKIHNLFAFVSARYEVIKEEWNGINLEVYHHSTHTYNVDKLMEGMKNPSNIIMSYMAHIHTGNAGFWNSRTAAMQHPSPTQFLFLKI